MPRRSNLSSDNPKSALESVRANQREQSVSFRQETIVSKRHLYDRATRERYGLEESWREIESGIRFEEAPARKSRRGVKREVNIGEQ